MCSPWRLCSRMISSPMRPRWCILHGDYGTGWFTLLWTGWFPLLWTGWFALLWTRWFALFWDRMIGFPMDRMISSPIEASYPSILGLMGSTSHLINKQGNGVRDHSSTIDGRIVVSTVLPMLGWPLLSWDQRNWSGISMSGLRHSLVILIWDQ